MKPRGLLDPDPKPTISARRPSIFADIFADRAPGFYDAVSGAARAVRQNVRTANARPNPFKAVASLLGLDQLGEEGGTLSMIEGPAAAGVGLMGRVGKEVAGEVGERLSMETADRMARAQAMGFSDETFYKGLYPFDWRKEVDGVPGPPIEELRRTSPFPSFGGSDGDIPADRIAAFMSKDPEVANRFAQGAVMPLRLRKGRVFETDAAGRPAGDLQFGPGGRGFRDAARSGEYDTIVIRNTADEGDVYVALKPENIRSAFARFDPAQINSANLSAGVAGILGIGAAANRQERK